MHSQIYKFSRSFAFIIIACVCLNTAYVEIAAAQTSQNITAANPRNTYAFFKNKESKTGKPWTKVDVDHNKGKLNISDCYSSQVNFGPAEPLLTNLFNHAQRIVGLQNRLSLYPSELWKQDLQAYEEKTLIRIADKRQPPKEGEALAFEETLARKLNDYRKIHTQFPPVENELGCGDGEVAVEIVALPKPKRVQYISFYYFELCKEQALDPLDTSHCDRWTDFGSKDALFAGRYKVLVTWSNGEKSVPRDLDVDSLTLKKGSTDTRRFIIKQ
jgi:hypothetical protein